MSESRSVLVSKFSRLTAILAITISVLCVAVFLYFRFLYVSEPAGNDESLYYYMGNKVWDFGKPYYDYYEMKPPMLFFSYALAVLVAGYTVEGMHLAGIAVSALTALFIFFTLRRKYSLSTALLSTSIWLLFYSSPMVYGTYLMSEHFVGLFASIGSFAILFKPLNVRNIFIAGIMMAAALLVKQSALVFFPAFVYLISRDDNKWKNFLIFGGAVLGFVAVNFLVILLFGSIEDARYWLFQFPKEYVSTTGIEQGIDNLIMFANGIFRVDFIFWAIFLATTITVLVNWKKRESKFALLLLLGAMASLLPGLRFYPQYWILLVFSAAFILPISFDKINSYRHSYVFVIVLLAGLITQFYVRSDFYFPDPNTNAGNKYMVGQFLERSKEMGKFLKRTVSKSDELLVLGAIPQLYIYAGKKAPVRHVWTSMLSLQSEKNKLMQEEFMTSINEIKPDYVVFSYSPYHWNLRSSNKDFIYTAGFRFVNHFYSKIAVMDLETGQIVTGSEAATLSERANTYAVYKKL